MGQWRKEDKDVACLTEMLPWRDDGAMGCWLESKSQEVGVVGNEDVYMLISPLPPPLLPPAPAPPPS